MYWINAITTTNCNSSSGGGGGGGGGGSSRVVCKLIGTMFIYSNISSLLKYIEIRAYIYIISNKHDNIYLQ